MNGILYEVTRSLIFIGYSTSSTYYNHTDFDIKANNH